MSSGTHCKFHYRTHTQQCLHLQVHATMALRLAEWISNVHTDNLVTLTSCAAMVNKLKCLPPSARAELSQFAALSLSGEI